ncbi:MoxR family ATPase [Kitasatospora sp. NPDC093558]|uniref:AAA family ATPase n=1 Tax=Kitasatospora sp. NPDC093558 TaxID=3155201 RepID=UPI003415457A
MTGEQDYRRVFDPPMQPPAPAAGEPAGERIGARVGDRTMDQVYVYDTDIVLAVNVALATGRPLLVRGLPGTGKSSLAPNVARHLGRRFYRTTISSRTRARDLLWTVDEVARLSDAATGHAGPRPHYVVPGVLWWAFEPDSARRRGLGPTDGTGQRQDGSGPGAPAELPDPNEGTPGAAEAVVLLDEIDKADPDVPNDLLEPLGSYCFSREDGPLVEATTAPLVVLTTNEERDLPKAFLRRCVVHELKQPTPERLDDIAHAHFPDRRADDAGLFADVLLSMPGIGDGGPAPGQELPVSIAEYLDAIAASIGTGIRPGDELWGRVVAAITQKHSGLDQP